jgi:hypothetical protein
VGIREYFPRIISTTFIYAGTSFFYLFIIYFSWTLFPIICPQPFIQHWAAFKEGCGEDERGYHDRESWRRLTTSTGPVYETGEGEKTSWEVRESTQKKKKHELHGLLGNGGREKQAHRLGIVSGKLGCFLM